MLKYSIRSMRIEFRNSGGFREWFLRKLTRKTIRCDVCGFYVRKRNIAFTLELADGSLGYCCRESLENESAYGKFSQYRGDDDSLATALILYSWSLDFSYTDDAMGDCQYQGYFQRFCNFITCEDSQGFFTFEEFANAEAAEKEFDYYYKNGAGASEDDAYIGWESYRGWNVSFNGQLLGTFDTERRAKAAISVEMRKTGYFPNVWSQSERGDLALIEVW